MLSWMIISLLLLKVLGNILVVTENSLDPETPLSEGLENFGWKIKVIKEKEEESAYAKVCDALSSGASLILDLTWAGWTRLQDLCESSGLPYLRLESSMGLYANAVDQVLRLVRNATDAVFVVESELNAEELLYQLVSQSSLRVLVLAGLSSQDLNDLKEIRPSPSFYVLLGSSNFVSSTIKSLLEHNLVRRRERLVAVLTPLGPTVDGPSYGEGLRVTPSRDLCCQVLDQEDSCQCPQHMDVLEDVAKITLKKTGQLLGKVLQDVPNIQTKIINCKYPSVNKNNNGMPFYHQLKKSVPKGGWLGLRSTPSPVLYPRLTLDVRSPLPDAPPIATWSPELGLDLNHSRVLKKIRRFFRVGVAEAEPWSYQVRNPKTLEPVLGPGGVSIWTGYCLDMLDRLAQDLEFDFELVPSPKFGKKQLNGAWDGLVGDLVKTRTDLVVAPLIMTAEREEVIDFIAPYFDQSGISIVIRKPERQTSLFKFMTVLRAEVWLSIAGALILTAVMIWLLEKHSPYSARNKKHSFTCREFTLKESFWFALTSFTPQGGGETPRSLSGRTLVAAYWLFVVLMLATFTANLAAFLTVERMRTPVQSLEQLSRQSRINYTVVTNSQSHYYFRNMKFAEDTLYRVWKELALNASSDQAQFRVWDYPIREQYGHILQAIERTGPVADEAEGFRKVSDATEGWFALIHDAARVRYEVYADCELAEVGEPFALHPYAVAVQQGSLLNEEISRLILDLQKERYFEMLLAKYWNSSKANCQGPEDNEGITLESLGGVFIATLFGLALAMATLGLEIFLHKKKKAKGVEPVEPKVPLYPEYLSAKEFCTQPRNPTKLIPRGHRLIRVQPKHDIY